MGRMFEALQKVQREKSGELQGELQQEPPRVATRKLVMDSRLVSFYAPSSTAAEQFRRLRTHIVKPWARHTPRSLLVTSAMAGEGKTLIAINLAVAIATELQSHALIVDGDLRNPSLSRWFGFDGAKGLSDYLTSDVPLQNILVRTALDRLSILPGGSIQDNPAELAGSDKMKSLVAELKDRYPDRYIIIDSSPVLATTEPGVLVEMVDGILFVVKSGDTPRESVEQAIKQLDRGKIIGTVLNKLEFKTDAMIRRYFGTNRYYYNHGYNSATSKPGIRNKAAVLLRDMRAAMARLRPGKKDEYQ